MKREHELKIREGICDSIVSEDRLFDVRLNDRGFQKGDIIKYRAVDSIGISKSHEIDKKKYSITYVLSGSGVDISFVVIGFKEEK